MRYELFDFQKDAVDALLRKMRTMQRNYDADGELSSVSLTAPTASGKTVIAAAVIEALFYGNDDYPGDDEASVLWLSDSPSLNEQTIKRFDDASDMLNAATTLETITPDFAIGHDRLMPGHAYFLNRQLLTRKGRLTNDTEGRRTFWDVLERTIHDDGIHLYCFIDEAHRGIGKEAVSDSANKTIYAKLIDGQPHANPPMPCVIGISATPGRFNEAMKARRDRDTMAAVDVPVSAVKESGLIKDIIELRTPKVRTDTHHQDLMQACQRFSRLTRLWKEYCSKNGIPTVVPLMVIQVEDKASTETLGNLCSQILKACKWLNRDCFANVFGEHDDIKTQIASIPYCGPDDVADRTEIRVLFAKDAVSTGWNCPRAEVIYSRRRRNDPTYIAQLIGRMIRTPLARRIDSVEELNGVVCYLPDYDATTVESVVDKLREDNVVTGDDNGILKNPAYVGWYGNTKRRVERQLGIGTNDHDDGTPDDSGKTTDGTQGVGEDSLTATQQANGDNQAAQHGNCTTSDHTPEATVTGVMLEGHSDHDVDYIDDQHDDLSAARNDDQNGNLAEDAADAAMPDDYAAETVDDGSEASASKAELESILDRTPKVDDRLIRESFESIITRQVRHDKPNAFLDLWDCVDIITSDIDPESDLDAKVIDDFCNSIEAGIVRHPSEFSRTYAEICSTTITVKRVDPLTGEEYEDREESVQNDTERMDSYYHKAVGVFAGASDAVKTYINRYSDENAVSHDKAIMRISAVAACFEIVQELERWAEDRTGELLDEYGPQRYAIAEDNKARWERITGNAKPYVERTLSIKASVTRQNMDYDRYPKHIISDANGWAYLKLDDLEKAVVRTELANPLTIAWYRNQSRNLRASLSIPYMLGDEWENMYPDFIFFQRTKDGSIVRTIVDPHGYWLGDSIAKLKGYVMYLDDHPEEFGSVLAVTGTDDGTCRYLDLMDGSTQKAIRNFTGSTAKELFFGPYGKQYKLKDANGSK